MAKGRARQQPKSERKKSEPPKKKITSDEVMQETFIRHFHAYETAVGIVEDAQSQMRNVLELAKNEGVTKRSLKFALALKKDDGPEKAKAERDEQFRVATWLGFGKQLEMFEEAGDAIFEEGKRAAMANEPRKPPAHHAQKAAQRWMLGWDHGMKIVNANREEHMNGGFRPLADAAADLAEQAGVSAGLGETAPTHSEAAH